MRLVKQLMAATSGVGPFRHRSRQNAKPRSAFNAIERLGQSGLIVCAEIQWHNLRDSLSKRRRREMANSNERKRMQQINQGYLLLQELVPNTTDKMSKASLLQHTAAYIRNLQASLARAQEETASLAKQSGGGSGPADDNHDKVEQATPVVNTTAEPTTKVNKQPDTSEQPSRKTSETVTSAASAIVPAGTNNEEGCARCSVHTAKPASSAPAPSATTPRGQIAGLHSPAPAYSLPQTVTASQSSPSTSHPQMTAGGNSTVFLSSPPRKRTLYEADTLAGEHSTLTHSNNGSNVAPQPYHRMWETAQYPGSTRRMSVSSTASACDRSQHHAVGVMSLLQSMRTHSAPTPGCEQAVDASYAGPTMHGRRASLPYQQQPCHHYHQHHTHAHPAPFAPMSSAHQLVSPRDSTVSYGAGSRSTTPRGQPPHDQLYFANRDASPHAPSSLPYFPPDPEPTAHTYAHHMREMASNSMCTGHGIDHARQANFHDTDNAAVAEPAASRHGHGPPCGTDMDAHVPHVTPGLHPCTHGIGATPEFGPSPGYIDSRRGSVSVSISGWGAMEQRGSKGAAAAIAALASESAGSLHTLAEAVCALEDRSRTSCTHDSSMCTLDCFRLPEPVTAPAIAPTAVSLRQQDS